MNKLFLTLIILYKHYISPFLPTACRFYPTCSNYSILALSKYNCLKAIFIISKRLIRCNPLFKGGYDPL